MEIGVAGYLARAPATPQVFALKHRCWLTSGE